MGTRINPGIAIKLFPSSIGGDSNPQTFFESRVRLTQDRDFDHVQLKFTLIYLLKWFHQLGEQLFVSHHVQVVASDRRSNQR